jgi:hypothetical protein
MDTSEASKPWQIPTQNVQQNTRDNVEKKRVEQEEDNKRSRSAD